MAYVTIPKDLSRIQSKVLFGLTKRQVICFGAAALVGVPLFFLAKASLGTTTAALCMILVMLPFGSSRTTTAMWTVSMTCWASMPTWMN